MAGFNWQPAPLTDWVNNGAQWELVDCVYQDGRVMMLEPVGEEDEADLLRQDDDDANQSGQLFIIIINVIICFTELYRVNRIYEEY